MKTNKEYRVRLSDRLDDPSNLFVSYEMDVGLGSLRKTEYMKAAMDTLMRKIYTEEWVIAKNRMDRLPPTVGVNIFAKHPYFLVTCFIKEGAIKKEILVISTVAYKENTETDYCEVIKMSEFV
jgi:hypothetical protein